MPKSVQVSLNKAALDVKQNTMPAAAKVFTQRAPTFFKSTSRVEFAKGLSIPAMQSTVGFIPQSGPKESGGATQDLQQQENAGRIGHRAFIPTAKARVSGSNSRRVVGKFRLAVIKSKIASAKNNAKGTGNSKMQYVLSALHVGKGGYLIGEKGLYRVNSIKKIGGELKVNSTLLYSVEKGRAVNVKGKGFMRKASNQSGTKIESFFIAEAEKQILKYK